RVARSPPYRTSDIMGGGWPDHPTGPATSWVPRSSRLYRDERDIRRTPEQQPPTSTLTPHRQGTAFRRAASAAPFKPFRSAEGVAKSAGRSD
ncbi:MAG TPA: hypothetical protein VN734_16110, partial [Acidobacteriaceae bacterium]|nr:hypothetical protein [Acidobacteriaceae bacterium]